MDLPLTIRDAAAGLRDHSYTSTELTTAMLAKSKELNPTLGAFIAFTEEGALKAAADADANFASGVDKSPLQGIPLAVKDIIATADAPTTANSLVLAPEWGDGIDAAVVEKLRAAGAAITGKLVLNEFATGQPDPAKPFPMPQNPWDLPRSASGSSSGTGLAVSAGMVLGGLGTDTGGSTRGPSSFNGISGIKQTFGRVSKYGCVPLGYSLNHINPMARSAYDCALILQVIAGYDPRDPTTIDVPVPDYIAALTGSVAGVRIGIPTTYFFDAPELDAEVKASVMAAIETLKAAGATVVDVPIPYLAEAKDANTIIMAGESGAYHRPDVGTKFDDYGRFTVQSVTRGNLYSASDYVQAQRFRSYFKKAVAAAMAPIDVLITPTSTTTATLREEMMADPNRQLTARSFTGVWNLTGLPAMAIPTGMSSAALPMPMSMQIIGKPFAEEMVLNVADAYQRMTAHHLNVPPIAAAVAV